MSLFIKHYRPGLVLNKQIQWRLNSTVLENHENEEEFRVLDILKKRERYQKKVARRIDVPTDRADKMPTDQVNNIHFSELYNPLNDLVNLDNY